MDATAAHSGAVGRPNWSVPGALRHSRANNRESASNVAARVVTTASSVAVGDSRVSTIWVRAVARR
jgi:hypothetical protein